MAAALLKALGTAGATTRPTPACAAPITTPSLRMAPCAPRRARRAAFVARVAMASFAVGCGLRQPHPSNSEPCTAVQQQRKAMRQLAQQQLAALDVSTAGPYLVRVRYARLTSSAPRCRHAQAERASPAAESSFLSLMDDEDEFEDDEYEAGQEVLKVKATEEVDETLKVRPRSACVMACGMHSTRKKAAL